MVTTYVGTVKEGKVEFEPPLSLSEGSQVRIKLSPVLSKRKALGKANIWLAQYVGDAIGAMNGTLVQTDDQILWRFGAFITSVHFDPVGPIGQIDVDADTGQVLNTFQNAEVMIEHGRQFAQGCSVLKSRGANIRCDALNALSSLAIYCVKQVNFAL